MNIQRRTWLLGCATLLLAACAARPELSRISDPEVDFGAYRSFALLHGDGPLSLIDRRLLAAARKQLERRGYVQDDLTPDLLINIAAAVEERQDPGGDDFTTRGAVEAERHRHHRLGRLAIDVFDARRRQVVWHGSAEGRVSPAMMRDAGSAVETAVAAVFEGFPLQPVARAASTAPSAP